MVEGFVALSDAFEMKKTACGLGNGCHQKSLRFLPHFLNVDQCSLRGELQYVDTLCHILKSLKYILKYEYLKILIDLIYIHIGLCNNDKNIVV